MKRYKFQALLTLLPQRGGEPQAALAGPACRMVVRAQHHESRAGKFFSALVSPSAERPLPGDSHMIVTVVLVGDDAADYLAPGERFALWRGHDVGRGVVTRRIFV